MNINQMLQQTGAVDAISRQLGVDPATAEAGASALLPSILSGFQNPVATSEAAPASSAFPGLSGGLGGLLGTIGSLGGAACWRMSHRTNLPKLIRATRSLASFLGRRTGAGRLPHRQPRKSGVEPSLLKKMLPILAMVAAGYVMKHAGQSGGLGGVFGGGAASDAAGTNAEPQASGSGDILGQIMGAAGKFLGR